MEEPDSPFWEFVCSVCARMNRRCDVVTNLEARWMTSSWIADFKAASRN